MIFKQRTMHAKETATLQKEPLPENKTGSLLKKDPEFLLRKPSFPQIE
jgi:hypothetical protein